ncbi:DUF1127 domain-containing protein [Mesorhizobium sp. LHD-90]|uniref:DUF1127 domain-containing protein n=1 Tax=Mesorhizobium sp. LHD-90 TaxID=3071414 RepID=UPI0027E080CD|nr:DUF1127 domain-containing protein [Mesorhizobium sp. LHD-90]MDQ6435112.1 DUF1127 domain-containing protein [Mesorhizobium sp. LHD-90]
MSALTVTTGRHRDSSLSTLALRLLEFLHAKISRRQAIEELEKLSDHDLQDVGLERRDIAAAIDGEMNRISLRTLGR